MSVSDLASLECPECVEGQVQELQPDSEIKYWECSTCHGTGRRFWQLWRECEARFCGQYSRPCGACHGTGWVLRPEAEWAGILDAILLLEFGEVYMGKIEARGTYYVIGDEYNLGFAESQTLNGAKAQAIMQSLGAAIAD